MKYVLGASLMEEGIPEVYVSWVTPPLEDDLSMKNLFGTEADISLESFILLPPR
jgi:hypothetical protein